MAFGRPIPPNARDYQVIRPVGSGDLPNNYFSVPIATHPTDWGLPLTLQFEPPSAKIVSAVSARLLDIVAANDVNRDGYADVVPSSRGYTPPGYAAQQQELIAV